MACSERDENERDIPLMDLLDRWESHHKIQEEIQYGELKLGNTSILRMSRLLQEVHYSVELNNPEKLTHDKDYQ